MILKPLSAMMMLGAVQTAFTVGAVAGTAGVIGLLALRRALKERQGHHLPTD